MGCTLTNEGLLKARARNPIECKIKNHKVILQGNFGQCPKVALRVRGTDPEVSLGLQSKDARTQELMRAKQHVFLASLHVDFDIVSQGNYAFGQQAVQPPEWNHAVLLRRLDPKPASCLLIHGAGSRIDRIEVEFLLAVGVSQGHAVIMMIGAALVRFDEFLNNLPDGIEAMYNEIIVQKGASGCFAHPVRRRR